MEYNAQPKRVLVSEKCSYERWREPDASATYHGRVPSSSSTEGLASGSSGRYGGQHSRTTASTSSEGDSLDSLASMIPSQDFDTSGHLNGSLWDAAVHYISRLTGDRIESAFDVHPGESFQMNDNGCREKILRIVPGTCLLNDYSASRNLQAASAAIMFIHLLLDGRIRLNQPVTDVKKCFGTLSVPAQRPKEAEDSRHCGSPGLTSEREHAPARTAEVMTSTQPNPFVSSPGVIECMKAQERIRAAQLEHRHSENLAQVIEPKWDPPKGPKATRMPQFEEAQQSQNVQQKEKKEKKKIVKRIGGVKAAKARLLENVHSFQGIKKFVNKGLDAHQTAAAARARVQPILSAIADLEAAMRESSNDSTSN